MTTYIICDEAQRDHIVANTPRMFPIPLKDGVDWVLPVACLVEPDLADWYDYLAALPHREVVLGEFVPSEEVDL